MSPPLFCSGRNDRLYCRLRSRLYYHGRRQHAEIWATCTLSRKAQSSSLMQMREAISLKTTAGGATETTVAPYVRASHWHAHYIAAKHFAPRCCSHQPNFHLVWPNRCVLFGPQGWRSRAAPLPHGVAHQDRPHGWSHGMSRRSALLRITLLYSGLMHLGVCGTS